MHIPDAVLSPTTSAVCAAAMLPVWTIAGRRVRSTLQTRQIPLLALGSACCFTIMMFNIPALGGTTAHPVAGTILAVLLGPWVAVIGVSVALAIQALFFGDGGLLTFGANCFTMAFVLPFVGYSVYRLLAGSSRSAARLSVSASIGSFIGINAAAAVVAVILGIQPALFHEANGHALYFPFGLHITLPAMLGTHLLVAGPAEAIVTGLAIRYLLSAKIPLYGMASVATRSEVYGKRRELLWVGVLALAALSPLGLLAKGDAWGEWDAAGLRSKIEQVQGQSYVPKGAARIEDHDYHGVRGLADYASDRGWIGYAGSAVLGVTCISAIILLAGRLLGRRSIAEKSREVSSTETTQDSMRERLPDWLMQPSDETPGIKSDRSPSRYLERTVGEMAAGAASVIAAERIARADGFLQRIDSRARLISFVGLIAVTTCLHRIAPLLFLYCFTLVLAAVSRIPLGGFMRRVWLTVPLFIGAVTLPAALNVVTPGHELITLWTHPHLALTAPGMALAWLITLRVAVAVSLATLLTQTAHWNELLRSLRSLLVPRAFVAILGMTYRYIGLMLRTSGEIVLARRSRTVGAVHNADGRRFIGIGIGNLLRRTIALADEVHGAMVSRGYDGEIHTLYSPVWRTRESLWTITVAAVGFAAMVMG